MKILIAVNNSSVGAVKNAIDAAQMMQPGAEITLLVKENTEKGFKTFFPKCNIITYVAGATATSAESVNSFLEGIKRSGYFAFIVVKEKDTSVDIKNELIGFFCEFKKYYIFDAVKNRLNRQLGLLVYLRIVFSGLLPSFVSFILFLCFTVIFLLGLPGYLLKGDKKSAVVFLKQNIFNLASYFLLGIKEALHRFRLELFIYLEYLTTAYKRKAVFEKTKVKKILVLKIEHLGDFILATPMLRALRAEFPQAKITMLVSPWNVKIAEGCPYIDELLIYKTNNPVFNRGKQHRFLFVSRILFYLSLRRKGFDLCLDAGGWVESFKLSYASGAKFKGALDYGRVKNIHNIRRASFGENDNEIIRSFKLVGLFDIKGSQEEATEYRITPVEIETAKKILSEKGITEKEVLIGFYIGASSAPLRWDRDNFIKVINALPVKSGLKVIIFSAPGDRVYIEGLTAGVKVPFILMPENQSLKEFAAMVSLCRLFVSNDGGLSHLATAVKVKTVTLYGPSNVKEWGSYSKSRTVITKNYPCSPCRKSNCIKNLCMEAIKVEEVLEAIKCGLE